MTSERADPMAGVPALYVVQERDIDLLLLEELHSSEHFAAWFCERVGLGRSVFDRAWYSVSGADGETDLLLRVRLGSELVGVLVEDKVAASEQPHQSERYHARGQRGIEDGWFDRYVTCICAPRSYLNALPADSKYEHRIPYEDVAFWFDQQTDRRSAWRSDVIRAAVAQARKGYIKQVNEAVSNFHMAYYDRLCRTQANLLMSPPTPKGSDGTWIILWVRGWPSTIHLNHKLRRGSVELSFERNTRDQLLAFAGHIPADVRPIQTGQYGSLAISVPVIDVAKPFGDQIAAVDTAFAAMQALVPLAQLREDLSNMLSSMLRGVSST